MKINSVECTLAGLPGKTSVLFKINGVAHIAYAVPDRPSYRVNHSLDM